MLIFSPGPANISERTRNALLKPDICHRDTDFERILLNVRSLMRELLEITSGYEIVFFGGSGTSAIESVIASFGDYKYKILVVSNGIYGERASDIGRHYGVTVDELRYAWGQLPDLRFIEERLKEKDVGAIYIVHHETTTGLINPLKEIAGIAKKYNKLILVDGVSSIAGEELDIAGWGLDAVIGSSNKCIRGIPGISFVIASQPYIKTIEKCKNRSYYTNFLLHYKAERKGQTPFTPPVQAYYALEEALNELKEEGINNRIIKYRQISEILRKGLKILGIRLFLRDNLMSNTMTVVYAPDHKEYAELHPELKKRGFVIYASQGELSQTTFRLGTVGVLSSDDIENFLGVLKTLL